LASKAVIAYTDNSLPDPFGARCRELLLRAIGDIELICVSQKPLAFGRNLVIGDIGRSHLSLYRQMLMGLEATDAEVVYLAEHDCIYTPEHFAWEPPWQDVFYYNMTCWFVNWKPETKERGLYSSPWGIRKATSQLVSNRELLAGNIRERISMLEDGWTIRRGMRGACEPGVAEVEGWIRRHDDGIGHPRAWDRKWTSATFATVLPNLDVRHGGNLTGWRRGKRNRWELEPWGRFEDLMNGS
jgi:hypothetical protein